MPPVALDFETEKIDTRPHYPPKPVGLAIQWPGEPSRYLAFGHPSGNNCERDCAVLELARAYAHPGGVVFHNAKFDVDVAGTHFKLQPPPYALLHDTMVLAFLHDPHQRDLALKIVGPKLLGRAPAERDVLRDWVIENVPEARHARSNWGAWISQAPGNLVASYAMADVEYTSALFNKLHPLVIHAGMQQAYEVEMRLIPILLKMEREGLHVDTEKLSLDVQRYGRVLESLDARICKRLKTKNLNIDSNEDLAEAVDKAGKAKDWVLTPIGKRSTSKENLKLALTDATLLALLEYRGTLATCLNTFMRKWLPMAEESGGRIYTQWNSTKQPEGGGTRTGRLSSSNPCNLQTLFASETLAKAEKGVAVLKLKLPALPRVRRYVIAEHKRILVGADFAQQEPRSLAHFEDDVLARGYRQTPDMDVYIYAMEVMQKIAGVSLDRKKVKVILLAVIYGLGLTQLAEKLGCTYAEATSFKGAFLSAFPGIKEIMADLKSRGKSGCSVRTWGGRVYFAEPPRIVKGQLREFSYKLLNILCQGTAADMTKQAMLRFSERAEEEKLLLQVHDELLISAPEKGREKAIKLLKWAMEEVPGFGVPILSDTEVGYNWGDMEAV